MTDIERFNLYWLCHAMAAWVKSEDLYYYDARTKRFFSSRSNVLFDMVDLPMIDSRSRMILFSIRCCMKEINLIMQKSGAYFMWLRPGPGIRITCYTTCRIPVSLCWNYRASVQNILEWKKRVARNVAASWSNGLEHMVSFTVAFIIRSVKVK
jgi:hypothetical protein